MISLACPQNILNDSEGMDIISHVQKCAPPERQNAREKALFQNTGALLVFLGHFIVSPSVINEGLCALTLTGSTLENLFFIFPFFFFSPQVLLANILSIYANCPTQASKQLIMARFPEQVFKSRFAGRKLQFSCTCFSFPFALLMQH